MSKYHILKSISIIILIVISQFSVKAQGVVTNPGTIIGSDTTRKVITTAVPFLSVAPDARSGAMGDVGVALSPDANSTNWNPAKLVFLESQIGASISYTPWLGKIINDMSISYLSGYYKISREQAVALSFRYFDLGDITFREDAVDQGIRFNPREYAISGYYSRMLTDQFSIGVGMRFIRSNLTGSFTNSSANIDSRPGSSVAADISVYYAKDLLLSGKNSHLAFGADISNIGRKITYTNEDNRDFIPTNLRLGTAFTTSLDPFNTLTFAFDINKLMVPTPSADSNEKTLLSGMFSSFGDAPGGFSEEIQELMLSFGIEYWYNKTFAARTGYFYENKEKGNRRYLTMGVGFRYQVFGIDFAYLIPSERTHPLAETLRFTLLFDLDKGNVEESIVE